MLVIKLFCGGGMSSSILAERMREIAKKRGLDCYIEAYPTFMMERLLEQEHTDVILIGPQVAFTLPQYSKFMDKKGIPYTVIPGLDYGRLNGEKVLDLALNLINNNSLRNN